MLIQEIQRFNDKEAREGSSDVKTDDKGREEQRADQNLKVKDLKNLMLDYKIVKENIKKRFVPQFMMSASM